MDEPTSSALLVILLRRPRMNLDYQSVSPIPSAFSFIIPFIPEECLPGLDPFSLFPAALNRFLESDVYAQRLKHIVSTVNGGKIAPNRDVVEVERVRTGDVGI